MIRNLKALGLAVFAICALGATMASAASAQQGVLTADEPVTLTGTTGDVTPGPDYSNALTGPLGQTTCETSTFTGHKYNETPHEYIASGATTVTITPHYINCKAHIPILGTRPATVTMNGCDYVFHIGETAGGENTYGVTADVVCSGGNKIELHIYKTSSTEHLPEDSICTVKVGPQNGLSGPHLTQETTGDEHVDLVGTFENIHTENEGSLCGTGTSETADLDVNVTISAHNELGEPEIATITD